MLPGIVNKLALGRAGFAGRQQCDLAQMRAVLEAYQAAGGAYREVVLADCGHSPHIEQPEEFRKLLFEFLDGG